MIPQQKIQGRMNFNRARKKKFKLTSAFKKAKPRNYL